MAVSRPGRAVARRLPGLLDDVERAVPRLRPSAEEVGDGLRCLLDGVAAEPELARCSFVELCAVGIAGVECRRRALERLAVLLRPGSDTGGGLSVSDGMLACGGAARDEDRTG